MALSYVFSDRVANWFTRVFSKKLVKELQGEVTDKFLELLLTAMDAAFWFSRSFRKNLKGFNAVYVFETVDGSVHTTAQFAGSDMRVFDRRDFRCTARVIFKDPKALRSFLFSKDQDILNSLMANEVEVKGNINYIYKFGFMARDLFRRLGMD